jgi:SAM-dependent methyltransferase
VDLSPKMLAIAREKAEAGALEIEWLPGDIRNVRLNRKFDVVISMFAVIGYQTNNQNISDTFETARLHLKSGGLFLFDVWFGPAVLANRPSDRVKIIDQGQSQIIRLAQPDFDLMQQTVVVNYSLLHLQGNVILDRVVESHKMRFFFPQEIAYFLSRSGFRVLKLCPFLFPDRIMTSSDFNLTVLAETV